MLTFFRAQSRTSRRIMFDDSSQNLSIGSMSEKSIEDSGMSLQVTNTLIESISSPRHWCVLILANFAGHPDWGVQEHWGTW